MTETSELVQDAEWQRLDRRMLLVYPLRDLIRFLPVLIGLVDRRFGLRRRGRALAAARHRDPGDDGPAALRHHELPDHRGTRGAEAGPDRPPPALDPHRTGAHGGADRIAVPPRARPDHGADRYRNRVHQRRGRHRPRRAPGAAGARAARGAAPRLGAGRGPRPAGGHRPTATARAGGAPAGPALGPVRTADQRRRGTRRRCDRCRQPDPGRPRRLGPAQRRRRGRRALAGVAVRGTAAGGRGRRPGLRPGGRRLPDDQLGLHPQPLGGRPLLAPAPRAHDHPRDEPRRRTRERGVDRRAAGPAADRRRPPVRDRHRAGPQAAGQLGAGAARAARGRRGRGRRGARQPCPGDRSRCSRTAPALGPAAGPGR